MKKQALQVLSFVITLAIVIGVLKLVNWAPRALEPGLMAEYPSIDAVEATLAIRKIYVPAYFPETISWPPATVLAKGKPFLAVVMRFTRASDGATVLVISQATSQDFQPDVPIRFHTITERVPLDLKGRSARLEAGMCDDRTACSHIEWDEGDRHIMLTMKAPAGELIKIANSMLH